MDVAPSFKRTKHLHDHKSIYDLFLQVLSLYRNQTSFYIGEPVDSLILNVPNPVEIAPNVEITEATLSGMSSMKADSVKVTRSKQKSQWHI